jgi:dTMP kinase
MFVVFEGIDGSGKTTLSNQVVTQLRAQGLQIKHLRAEGKFASRVTEAIRTLGRDARNLDLDPKAEFLLYVARELQLVEEVLKPALSQHDLIVADRYFPTAEVLARYGRHLPREFVTRTLQAVASEIVPDLIVLVDVDPTLARARRKAQKLAVADRLPPSRRGLAGVGLQHRLRAGYLALAHESPERWFVLNNEAELEDSVRDITQLISRALQSDARTALGELRRRSTPPRAAGQVAPAPRSASDALTVFLAWLNQRAAREPRVAAYMLSGLSGPALDELRLSLTASVPEAVLAGLSGLADDASFRLRERLKSTQPGAVAASLVGIPNRDARAAELRASLLAQRPGEVLASLATQPDASAWQMRQAWFDAQPHAVMRSLRGLGDDAAWALRERWLAAHATRLDTEYELARTAAVSVSGSHDERAWRLREAAAPAAPVAALHSIMGLTCERSWQQRERYLLRAPKIVMATLRSLRDARAWELRRAVAADCKEALDSIFELDDPEAWELRERFADVWASTAVKSLGGLADGARGRAFLERQLAAHPDNISLLKHASAVALGVRRGPAMAEGSGQTED